MLRTVRLPLGLPVVELQTVRYTTCVVPVQSSDTFRLCRIPLRWNPEKQPSKTRSSPSWNSECTTAPPPTLSNKCGYTFRPPPTPTPLKHVLRDGSELLGTLFVGPQCLGTCMQTAIVTRNCWKQCIPNGNCGNSFPFPENCELQNALFEQ